MKNARRLVALCVGLASMAGASAATYRCLGADGKVTYADRPCEASQQTVATLGVKGKAPAPAASAASAASAPLATVVSVARPAPQR